MINMDNFRNLRNMLIKHEGIRYKPYKDTENFITIGVGRNLDSVGISQEEMYLLLNNDIKRAVNLCSQQFAWLNSITPARQDVVISMVFNMGLNGFLEFEKMIAALVAQDYMKAADEMMKSKWADQVGQRADDLATIMRKGYYPPTFV